MSTCVNLDTRTDTPCDIKPNNIIPLASSGKLTPERQALVVQHLRLVTAIAFNIRRGKPSSILLEDLIAAGNLALCEAAIRFDPSRGNKFITYAYTRITGACIDELRRSHKAAGGSRIKPSCVDLCDPSDFDAFASSDKRGTLESQITVSQLLRRVPAEDHYTASSFVSETCDEMGAREGITRSWAHRKRVRTIEKLRRLA